MILGLNSGLDEEYQAQSMMNQHPQQKNNMEMAKKIKKFQEVTKKIIRKILKKIHIMEMNLKNKIFIMKIILAFVIQNINY